MSKRVAPSPPDFSLMPGLFAARVTEYGMNRGSFCVTLVTPAKKSITYQTPVIADADIDATDADGESRLDLYPLVLRAITEARQS